MYEEKSKIGKVKENKFAQVYFISLQGNESAKSIAKKTELLLDKTKLFSFISAKKIVGIKQHFGEKGNKGYIKPEITKKFIDLVKHKKGKPLLIETNTLYKGERSNSYDHIILANKHGFSIENVGAPIVIVDGLNGQNQTAIPISGIHFKKVYIASDIPFLDSMIILSHTKGHIATGLGGALKNLSMGLSSRAGKLAQHSDFKPKLNLKKCIGCGLCKEHCPAKVIKIVNNKAVYDLDKCIGCGECYTVCQHGVISFDWDSEGKLIQEKIAEHALGATINHKKKIVYINYFNHITKQCDCWGGKNPVLYKDVGIFAGSDPVAVDTACIDMAKEKLGVDVFNEMWPDIDPTIQMKHAEKIGLGTRKYKLIEL
jgi:uncharacterized Fe-S center protein